MVVLYTDGVIESRPIDDALGERGLMIGSGSGGWSAEAIEEAVNERSEGRQWTTSRSWR